MEETEEIKRLTQEEWVKSFLGTDGYITRNFCLRHYISRLGAIIARLKNDGYEFNTEYITVKIEHNWVARDYKYTVTKYPPMSEKKLL